MYLCLKEICVVEELDIDMLLHQALVLHPSSVVVVWKSGHKWKMCK